MDFKFKTLKDLRFFNKDFREYHQIRESDEDWIKSQIKEEAIKWVKEDIRLDSCISPRTKTWMKRLNITEEELKSEDKQ